VGALEINNKMMVAIPINLHSGRISLKFEKIVSIEPGSELVPYYHFNIMDEDQSTVGHINFRVGETRHIMMCAGHIGYEVLPEYRGNLYSYHACKALTPFIKLHYDQVIMTVDPANLPSIRIIEKLGAKFINEIKVPADDPAYAGGARNKKRYEWKP
jgi:predicted acetyltransferase